MDEALFVAAIIGLTQFYRSIIRRDLEAAGLIFVSALGGAAIAYFEHQLGYSVLQGAVFGLSASGAVTLGKSFAQGTKLSPQTLTGQPTE